VVCPNVVIEKKKFIKFWKKFWLCPYSWAERSGDRVPLWERFSATVQTGPGAHSASCTMGTGSFRGEYSGRGVTLTPDPLLVAWSRKGRAIPLLPLWSVRPVQSLSACTRVNFIFTFMPSMFFTVLIFTIELCEYYPHGIYGSFA
jgi:hypothetical protein